MNPVRSLAPDLVRGNLGTTWVYVIGSLFGAQLRVAFKWSSRETHSHWCDCAQGEDDPTIPNA